MLKEYINQREHLKDIAKGHQSGFDKARRIFLEEPSFSTKDKRDTEYEIKSNISEIFSVEYHQVYFCGSAHLGISPHKGTLFELGASDLDIAIISPASFGMAFEQIAHTSRSFTDETVFGQVEANRVDLIKQRIYRRGCIHLNDIPDSGWAKDKRSKVHQFSKRHKNTFRSVSVAIYISDYFYCWKQKSAIDQLSKLGT